MNKNKAQGIRILVVDDEPMMSDSLRRHLEEEGYAIDTAATGAQAIDLFDGGAHHLVICDLQLPDMDGLTLLRHMKDTRPTTEVIVVTGYGSVQTAVEATKAGAFYFVEKPFDFEELSPLVEKALERRELMAETANMRRQLSTRAEYFNIIGSSKQMQTIYETIESVAKSDANVLIVGESGTGKELIANAIHYNSLRAKKPFIKVNCAALPKELIESELFGHTKGAFTGAHADKEGLVQHAAGGSLMLDEIAEMPIELQPKLLRVLQERTCRKIGSEKSYPADFRLITSTNRLPADAIRDGLLRDDLRVTLIESSQKKAVFLQEALRQLTTPEPPRLLVARFEETPAPVSDFITCRAIDRFQQVLPRLIDWAPLSSTLLLFAGPVLREKVERLLASARAELIPGSEQRFLIVARRNYA